MSMGNVKGSMELGTAGSRSCMPKPRIYAANLGPSRLGGFRMKSSYSVTELFTKSSRVMMLNESFWYPCYSDE